LLWVLLTTLAVALPSPGWSREPAAEDEPLRESIAGLFVSYGEAPGSTGTEGRLGLWMLAHGAAGSLALNRQAHPSLGTVTALDAELQMTLPLWRVFPTAGLGALLGTAGSRHPVVGALAPSLGAVWVPGERVWVALQARYYLWSSGRRHDGPVVALQAIVALL
jgi:hypothetical protein